MIAEVEALQGVDLPPSEWLEITQERVDEFAHATGDNQWIHVEPERAKVGPYGSTIAHGFLTLSLIPYFWKSCKPFSDAITGINLGLQKVRFLAPVPVPSRLRGCFRIERVTGHTLQIHVRVEREGAAKPVCVADVLFRYQPSAESEQ